MSLRGAERRSNPGGLGVEEVKKTYCVYIVTNKNNTVLCTGVTNDLKRRVYEHRQKSVGGFTRKYNANNQLDGASMDRFKGGRVKVDYDLTYESTFDSEVVSYVHRLREVIEKNGLRHIASTRSIIAGTNLKEGGFADWKDRITDDWSDVEKRMI